MMMLLSIIVNIIKSVHRVLFFVTPSLPKEYFENVDFFYRPGMHMQCIIMPSINMFIVPKSSRNLAQCYDRNQGVMLFKIS